MAEVDPPGGEGATSAGVGDGATREPVAARPVAPELERAIAQIIDDAATRPFSKDLSGRLEMLIDVLVARGALTPGHRRLLTRLKGHDISTVRLSIFADKRSVPSPDVDCASLIPICRGRCCGMDVSLSAEDVAEGKLRWDLHQPYLLRKSPDHGHCEHREPDGSCGVYDERPGTCRAYDCRNDKRVWIDFERRIAAPMPWHLLSPEERLAGERAQAEVAAEVDAVTIARADQASVAGEIERDARD
jgi:hypothetical protein